MIRYVPAFLAGIAGGLVMFATDSTAIGTAVTCSLVAIIVTIQQASET